MCIGCGICTTKCKFDAIKLEKITDAVNPPYFKKLAKIALNVPHIGANMVAAKVKKIVK